MKSKLTFKEYFKANFTWSNFVWILVTQIVILGVFLLKFYVGRQNPILKIRFGDALTIPSFLIFAIICLIGMFKLGFLENLIKKHKIEKQERHERRLKKLNALSPEQQAILNNQTKAKKHKERYKSNFVYWTITIESLILITVALCLVFA